MFIVLLVSWRAAVGSDVIASFMIKIHHVLIVDCFLLLNDVLLSRVYCYALITETHSLYV